MDAVYKEINSQQSWALEDDSLKADKETLSHKWCQLEATDE